MGILALGINHNTASVEVREKVAFGPEIFDQAMASLKQVVKEAVIVSTCNRVEIYCHDYSATTAAISTWLANFHSVHRDELASALYVHKGEDAVQHLMRVASGLDSLVLGEPQILGQLKQSFSSCQKLDATGTCLDRLFQQAFSVAKQVRTDTSIGSSAVSVAYAAVTLAKRIYSDMSNISALFIGAGETIELAARHLFNHG